MKNRNLFFIDAETDGLYGDFISVAMLVADNKGNEIDRLYIGINKQILTVENQWVQKNVVPIMGEYIECNSQDELLETAWNFWIRYRDSYCIADVTYPVECRLFEKCVMKNPQERAQQAPFPLMDLSSMLYAKGIEPLTDRMKLSSETKKTLHNAMNDIEISLKIWKEYING